MKRIFKIVKNVIILTLTIPVANKVMADIERRERIKKKAKDGTLTISDLL